MPLHISANKWVRLSLLMMIVAYLIFYAFKVHLQGVADDQEFLRIFNSGRMMDNLFLRFNRWSGRFAVEFLLITTIGYSFVWKIGIPAAIVLLCYAICRISGFRFSVVAFAVTLAMFASIPFEINELSSWWVTGFYNYLLPVSLAMYVFSVSFTSSESNIEKAICFLLACFFPYMEQAGIAYVAGMFLFLIFNRNKIGAFNVLILVVASINLAICLKSPGNEIRYHQEIWRWYPEYQTYGLRNKIALGFDKLNQLMNYRYNFPLIVLSASVFYLRSIKSAMAASVKVAMFIIATFIAISIANSFTGILSAGNFFSVVSINSDMWASPVVYLSYFYLMAFISSLLLVLIDMVMHKSISATPLFAILIGFMTVAIMGFSPTVFASSLRVDFIFEIMCITSCMYTLGKIITTRKANS